MFILCHGIDKKKIVQVKKKWPALYKWWLFDKNICFMFIILKYYYYNKLYCFIGIITKKNASNVENKRFLALLIKKLWFLKNVYTVCVFSSR